MQCDHQATTKGCLTRHKKVVHEGVKYPCNHQATTKRGLSQCKRAVHEGIEQNTLAYNATIKQIQRGILLNQKRQYMKESNTLAGNATIERHPKEILLNTKGQYTKASNTHAGTATIKQLERQVLPWWATCPTISHLSQQGQGMK